MKLSKKAVDQINADLIEDRNLFYSMCDYEYKTGNSIAEGKRQVEKSIAYELDILCGNHGTKSKKAHKRIQDKPSKAKEDMKK